MNSINIVDTSAPDGLAIAGSDENIDPEEDEELAEKLQLGIPKDADIRKSRLQFNHKYSVQLFISRSRKDTHQRGIHTWVLHLSLLW